MCRIRKWLLNVASVVLPHSTEIFLRVILVKPLDAGLLRTIALWPSAILHFVTDPIGMPLEQQKTWPWAPDTIHIHSQAPNISISAFHLSLIYVYQSRVKSDTKIVGKRAPDCQFGYRCEISAPLKHLRGATSFSTFVKGYADGCVSIWDYRNLKAQFKSKTP